ncbi:hypothetical protein HKD37_03G006998 [Glycine soja]
MLPFIFQEAKESIDEKDPRPTSSNGAYIMWYQEHLHLASSPSFLSKAHLGGEAPSSMAYSLVDGASSHLFSFVFRCISMDLIEAQRSGLHRSPTSKLPSSGIRAQELQVGVKGRSPAYEEPRDLRSNPFQGGGDDAILHPKGIG